MSSSFKVDLRVEDLLAAAAALSLATIAGLKAVLRSVAIDQSAYWQFSYFALPIALLTFIAAVRFAFSSEGNGSVALAARRVGTIFRDWLPFPLFLTLYESFQSTLWRNADPRLLDPALLRIDRMLFGETPAVLLQRFVTPVTTDVMAVCYTSHLVLPALLAIVLYLTDRDAFRDFLLSVLVVAIIGFAGYVAVPAVGPGSYYPQIFHTELSGRLQSPMLNVVDTARAPRDVFPSLHVAISALVLYAARRAGKGWFWALLPFVAGNWISTMYLRYHYAIDVICGWAAAIAAVYVTHALRRVELRWRGGAAMPAAGPQRRATPATARRSS